jgi:MoaA/NifB/PqqE/SkfB family radical SAM enzyme
MKKGHALTAWGRILQGRRPLLSLEITRECPLRCPGCYAYEPEHLHDAGPLRNLTEFRGDALISGVLALARRFRPIHISVVGGEPLVRYRELNVLLPKLRDMGIEVQLVTSAVRPIPLTWKELPNLHILVSIDGLQPEHDVRRAPATYDRILKHIVGHQIVVHCTITRQQVQRPGYLREFSRFWSDRQEVRKIWFSLFTPQQGAETEERLTPGDRIGVVHELARLRACFPKIHMPDVVLRGYLNPPSSPKDCIFAQTTTCFSADLATRIVPCQFGGKPVCSECGCIASAGLAAIGKYKLGGLFPLSRILTASQRIGQRFAAVARSPN